MTFSRRRLVATMTKLTITLPMLYAACIGVAAPASARDGDPEGPLDVVKRFTVAQQSFDQSALRELTDENYVEVSPIGDVDTREAMLGFYAPSKREEAPALTVSEANVRSLGDTAIVIAKVSFGAPGGAPGSEVSMRATFVARRISGHWKLNSLQYTPIRTKGPAK